MFESPSPHAEIKVIDFGLSKKFLGKPGLMTERVGTIYTMAPQVLQGVYSSQADLWSVGVIAYMLLSASKPFYARRRRRMIDLIMRGYVTYDAAVWEYISDDAKAFCNALLVVDPKKRLNAKQACKHPWIVNREKLPDEKPSEALLSSIDDCVLHYKQTSTLKKLALNVIAHKSTTSEIMQLRAVFDQYDTERNGVLSFEEFRSALEKMNYSDEELKEIFSSIDFNQNGKIMYTEFLAACLEVHGGIEEDRLAEAFDRIDSDDTGYISKENLREALGENCDTAQIDEIIAVADKNKDGTISYAEFLDCFREQTFVMANRAAEMPVSVSDVSEGNDLVGLDAKIPGGRFDSNLESSLRAQIESRYD
jgi:Ca2+-binding EF-hand superfamily protein